MSRPIHEAYLSYIWQTKQFRVTNLKTTDGQPIELIQFGIINHNAGPDVEGVKLRMDNMLWYGHVEFHVRASDWTRHKHNQNERFDNVILHVVWEEDTKIVNRHGQSVPCLELAPLIDKESLNRYSQLYHQLAEFIPCERLIHLVKEPSINMWTERLLVSKLEQKYNDLLSLYHQTEQHLEQTIFVYIARYFGLPSNQDLMEQLALRTPYNVLKKHADQLQQVEAILFGQAKLLNNQDEYAIKLNQEYQFLKQKYKLSPIPKNVWKLSRMRPISFPTVRLACLVALIAKQREQITNLLSIRDAKELKRQLQIKTTTYWDTHYHFREESAYKSKQLGEQFSLLLMINAIVPLQFFYGKLIKDEQQQLGAVDVLRQIKAESNSVITNWQALGIKADSAFESQALLYLKKEYCNNKKCLQCAIGHQLLKEGA